MSLHSDIDDTIELTAHLQFPQCPPKLTTKSVYSNSELFNHGKKSNFEAVLFAVKLYLRQRFFAAISDFAFANKKHCLILQPALLQPIKSTANALLRVMIHYLQ